MINNMKNTFKRVLTTPPMIKWTVFKIKNKLAMSSKNLKLCLLNDLKQVDRFDYSTY